MDFRDTPEEAAFRAEVRTWLEANAQRKQTENESFGEGMTEAARVEAAREWQRKKADAGYAAITWPKESGGRGGTPIQQVIYGQEEAQFLVPSRVYENSLGQCLPTVATWARPELSAQYLPRGLRGDDIWCQLFSEPAAGSDTGGIRTRAEKSGDEWVINGQKVWTSGAHFCDYGVLLARTDWDLPKQKGLTMFILDLKTPGVEIRPIHQMSGEREFCEVFLTDVRIPDTHRLGDVNQGWTVMLSTLMHERMSIGGVLPTNLHESLVTIARKATWNGRPAIESDVVKARIADAYLSQKGVDLIISRGITALSKGEAPGPEMSILKLEAARGILDLTAFAMELAGPEGMLGHEVLGKEYEFLQMMWLTTPGIRIAGGTEEIMRNTIAEHVLGLPREIRTDKDVPFRELDK
jgi:alkylation response protein AidB-like acyl-CoA dehydrogenase